MHSADGGALAMGFIGGCAGFAGWMYSQARSRGWRHPRLWAVGGAALPFAVLFVMLSLGFR